MSRVSALYIFNHGVKCSEFAILQSSESISFILKMLIDMGIWIYILYLEFNFGQSFFAGGGEAWILNNFIMVLRLFPQSRYRLLPHKSDVPPHTVSLIIRKTGFFHLICQTQKYHAKIFQISPRTKQCMEENVCWGKFELWGNVCGYWSSYQ